MSESGLSASDCRNIIAVSEFCASSRGGWSSYTYAKQTLGCRENDQLAFVTARPVMTACATIRKHLMNVDGGCEDDNDECNDGCSGSNNIGSGSEDGKNKAAAAACDVEDNPTNLRDDGDSSSDPASSSSGKSASTRRMKKELVLDVREPHVVKYDTSRNERKKLDMHTDKSEWTFLIALTEGRGRDYSAGGTYFQALNATVHLQRGQMVTFRGKLRHCGVSIQSGCRYLLVGFLVPQVK